MSRLDAFFPGMDPAQRRARWEDLRDRAARVQAHGWDDYRWTWSSGEVAGVAYVLGDQQVLESAGETHTSVLSRYAYDLFGRAGGREDEADGFGRTRTWFGTGQ